MSYRNCVYVKKLPPQSLGFVFALLVKFTYIIPTNITHMMASLSLT